MLRTGILNPALNALLSRVRHTNTLVIADRGFPFWKDVPTVDISMVDDIPKVLEVLRAIQGNFVIGRIYVAAEFRAHNSESTVAEFLSASQGIEVQEEPHVEFKRRVPSAIGLIRTGDTAQYANVILESA
jgi:D-ribose pyranase